MNEQLKWPPPVGQVTRVGNKLYTTCAKCRKIVKVNKNMLGGLHVCSR